MTADRIPRNSLPPPLMAAMMNPESYPDHPPAVELRQTHVSCAFLAGGYVYKIKKPVRFAFIDASTLDKRFRLCLEEVRLNRRLAPDVYLGVVPIVREDGRLIPDEAGHGRAEEYAVKMRRLAESGMLDRMVAEGDVSVAQIRAVAARLASFHAAADNAKAWTFGSAAAVWRLVHGNLAEIELDCAGMVDPDELDEFERYMRSFVESRWSLLNRRALGGRVLEGHGDLRCEHVSLADGTVTIIDCLEFSERLRYVDAASDVAFLAMDLDRLGAVNLSDEFVEAYRGASDDADASLVMPFYKLHRALVRAKVECLTARDATVEQPRRKAAAVAARNYTALALGYLRESAPALIVVCGMSGSGKSTIARRLRDRTGFELLRSDVVRKRMAGVAPTSRQTAEYNSGIYDQKFTRRTYAALLQQASNRLSNGVGVIMDATFGAPANRLAARDVAARADVPILFVECAAREEEIMRRLAAREHRNDEVSDAGVATYVRQRREFAPLDEIPEAFHLVVDTTSGVAPAVAAVRNKLSGLRVDAGHRRAHNGTRH